MNSAIAIADRYAVDVIMIGCKFGGAKFALHIMHT